MRKKLTIRQCPMFMSGSRAWTIVPFLVGKDGRCSCLYLRTRRPNPPPAVNGIPSHPGTRRRGSERGRCSYMARQVTQRPLSRSRLPTTSGTRQSLPVETVRSPPTTTHLGCTRGQRRQRLEADRPTAIPVPCFAAGRVSVVLDLARPPGSGTRRFPSPVLRATLDVPGVCHARGPEPPLTSFKHNSHFRCANVCGAVLMSSTLCLAARSRVLDGCQSGRARQDDHQGSGTLNPCTAVWDYVMMT